MSSLKTDIAMAFILGAGLLALLPKSPFQYFIQDMQNMEFLVKLEFVNWFIPFGQMIAIGQAWVACIAIYYGYEYALRFVKLIS